MNKEELKLEAKEYADKYGGKSNFDLWDTARFAYYQGAEPREKQIAELTEQNTSLLTSVENLNKSVQELEKKNVELKADNSEWEKASDKWKNLYDSTNEQLTEAKDIIKKLMHSPRECIYWYALYNKAKRFLKEIENER